LLAERVTSAVNDALVGEREVDVEPECVVQVTVNVVERLPKRKVTEDVDVGERDAVGERRSVIDRFRFTVGVRPGVTVSASVGERDMVRLPVTRPVRVGRGDIEIRGLRVTDDSVSDPEGLGETFVANTDAEALLRSDGEIVPDHDSVPEREGVTENERVNDIDCVSDTVKEGDIALELDAVEERLSRTCPANVFVSISVIVTEEVPPLLYVVVSSFDDDHDVVCDSLVKGVNVSEERGDEEAVVVAVLVIDAVTVRERLCDHDSVLENDKDRDSVNVRVHDRDDESDSDVLEEDDNVKVRDREVLHESVTDDVTVRVKVLDRDTVRECERDPVDVTV
jgi:hypothetical protein